MSDGLTPYLKLFPGSWIGGINMKNSLAFFGLTSAIFILVMMHVLHHRDIKHTKLVPERQTMIHLLNAKGYYDTDWTNFTSPNTTNHTKAVQIWKHPGLDILHTKTHRFLPNFKNPCWFESIQEADVYQFNKYALVSRTIRSTMSELVKEWAARISSSSNARRLRCLPYFLIVGQPKCGTTDVYKKIVKHPDVINPPIKELHWWSRNRQGRRLNYTDIIPLSDYVDMFDMAALHIEKRVAKAPGLDVQYHKTVTGEASASILWENDDWYHFPENIGYTEPLYTNPDYIHHVIPSAKIIICVRNPTDRLYSDYLYFTGTNKSAEHFHKLASIAIDVYNNCTKLHSARYCVYNRTVAYLTKVRLRLGMYSVYIKDWFKVFPRNQIFILSLEEYASQTRKKVQEIYKFLNIRSLEKAEIRAIIKSKIANKRKHKDRKVGNMYNETRKILNDFYRTYNKELAELLNDDKFLWEPQDVDYYEEEYFEEK